MGTKLLNEYRVDFADNHQEIFMAENMAAVARVKEVGPAILHQISRIRSQVGVETPIRPVKFNVAIWPEPAKENGCHAAPETWVVPEDTKVIFTAFPCEGYEFSGWFKKGETTALSTDLVAEIVIDYPDDPGELAAEYEARFAPIPPVTP